MVYELLPHASLKTADRQAQTRQKEGQECKVRGSGGIKQQSELTSGAGLHARVHSLQVVPRGWNENEENRSLPVSFCIRIWIFEDYVDSFILRT